MKNGLNLLTCIVAALGIFFLISLNTLYKISNRTGAPMFSQEIFAAGRPYWIGIGVAFLLGLLFYLYKRMK